MKLNVRRRNGGWEWRFEAAPVNGKRRQKSKSGYATKKDAMDAGTAAMAQYNAGGLVHEDSGMSVHDYLALWRERYVAVNCRPNTRSAYDVIIEHHLLPAIGEYRLSAITPGLLQDLINAKVRDGFARSYVQCMVAVLTSSFRYAVEPLHLLRTDPAAYLKMPRLGGKAPVQRVVLTGEQWSRIAQRFPAGNRFHIALLLGYHLGLRIGEACGLAWSDVDLDAGTVSVKRILTGHGGAWRFGPPKTATSKRTIKADRYLIDELRAWRHAQRLGAVAAGVHYERTYELADGQVVSAPICAAPLGGEVVELVCADATTGKMHTTDTFKYAARVIHFELGLDFNYHALRHTHATMLIEAGADVKDVSARLGHSNIRTTLNTYVHDTDAMASRSVDLFEKAITKGAHRLG